VRRSAVRNTLPAWPALFLLLATLAACAPLEIKTRNGVWHPVERGETLWRICAAYRVDMMSVCMFNGITDPDGIVQGQRLFIPGAKAVLRVGPTPPEVPEASGSPDVTKRTHLPHPPEAQGVSDTPQTQRSMARALPLPPVLPAEEVRFQWPVKGGRITSGFGVRGGRRHDGIDISAPHGTPVYAAESGKVVYSGSGIRGYGNLIIIQHRGQFSTVYAHNKKNMVAVDEQVRKGQQIATVGNTGRTTGNHLHLEVRKAFKPVDPMMVLPNLEEQGGAK